MTDSLVERVAVAIMKVETDDKVSDYCKWARAAISTVRQALVDEAESMKFSEDRHGLLCAVESIDEALK